jgi:hypothetical protein
VSTLIVFDFVRAAVTDLTTGRRAPAPDPVSAPTAREPDAR